MNWAWATSLDQFWRSPAFPMWLTLAAAGFFALIVLITLLRAEKSVANGALTVITLLAIGIAVAATLRGFGPGERSVSEGTRLSQPVSAALPALACIDDLAGDAVLTACEKALFGSADAAAAAVSYAASQITRLTASGDVVAADRGMTPELQALRRSIERDRYGLMAQVLVARDRCTASECAAFRALTDRHQIAANMEERIYDGLISRYTPSWNAPPPAPAAPVAAVQPWTPAPTGKPTNAEFPTAASTPAVSIMTPEPGAATTPAPPRPAPPPANAASPSARPPTSTTAPTLTAAKKPPAAKSARATAPVQLAPAAAASSPAAAAPAPAAAND